MRHFGLKTVPEPSEDYDHNYKTKLRNTLKYQISSAIDSDLEGTVTYWTDDDGWVVGEIFTLSREERDALLTVKSKFNNHARYDEAVRNLVEVLKQ